MPDGGRHFSTEICTNVQQKLWDTLYHKHLEEVSASGGHAKLSAGSSFALNISIKKRIEILKKIYIYKCVVRPSPTCVKKKNICIYIYKFLVISNQLYFKNNLIIRSINIAYYVRASQTDYNLSMAGTQLTILIMGPLARKVSRIMSNQQPGLQRHKLIRALL